MKFVFSNFQKDWTFLLVAVAIETEKLIIAMNRLYGV